jgi:hypothetical protein
VKDLLRWVRESLTQNVGLKLLSLLLAVLIHVVVQRDSVRETTVEIPVVVVGVPKGQVFTGDLPDVAKIRVRGRWGGIRELLADRSARIVLDASPYRNGERFVFEHRTVEQQLPSRHVEVLGLDPASVEIHLEPLEQRALPVDVSLTGEPAPGFRVTSRDLKVEPARITASGPVSEIRGLRSLRTLPYDLAGADADVRTTVHLAPLAGRHVKLTAEEVTLDIHLEELPIARSLAAQAVVVRGCPPRSRCLLEPGEVSVKVEGPVRAVVAFLAHPPDNLVFADVGNAVAGGERTVTLSVNLVKGLTLTPEPAVAKFSLLSEVPAPAPDVH